MAGRDAEQRGRARRGAVDQGPELAVELEKACLQLSREAQAELMRRKHEESCQRAAKRSEPGEEADPEADFDAIRYSGPENQRARVPSFFASEPPISLEKGDGQWRITTLGWYFASD